MGNEPDYLNLKESPSLSRIAVRLAAGEFPFLPSMRVVEWEFGFIIDVED